MAEEKKTEEQAEEYTMDALTQAFYNVFSQWQKIVIALTVVLVVCVIYSYAKSSQEEAEVRAWTAAAEARNHPNKEELADRLEAVVKKHGGTDAAFFIRAELMQAHFDFNKPIAARKVAKQLLSDSPAHSFSKQVRADYARLLEVDDQWTDALAQYELIVKSGESYLLPEATLGKARCLQQNGKADQAKLIYQDILRQ